MAFGWFFSGLGLLFLISGTIGFIRNSDFFIKIHALSLSNLYGINCLLLGEGIKSMDPIIFFSVCVILIFNIIITLSIIHIISRKAYISGIETKAKTRNEIDAELKVEEEKIIEKEKEKLEQDKEEKKAEEKAKKIAKESNKKSQKK